MNKIMSEYLNDVEFDINEVIEFKKWPLNEQKEYINSIKQIESHYIVCMANARGVNSEDILRDKKAMKTVCENMMTLIRGCSNPKEQSKLQFQCRLAEMFLIRFISRYKNGMASTNELNLMQGKDLNFYYSMFDENGILSKHLNKEQQEEIMYIYNSHMDVKPDSYQAKRVINMVNSCKKMVSGDEGLSGSKMLRAMHSIAIRDLKDSFGIKTNFDTIGSNEDEPEEIKDDDPEAAKTIEETESENNADGFGDKFTSNPKLTLTKEVRYELSKIPNILRDRDTGEHYVDTGVGLGFSNMLDFDYAFNVLMDMMSDASNSSDMMKILEYNKGKYLWMQTLIDKMNSDPNLKTKMFTGLCTANTIFRTHETEYVNGVKQTKVIDKNKPMGVYFLFDRWRHNYENGIVLSDLSIYDYFGKFDETHARLLFKKIGRIYSSYETILGYINNDKDLKKLVTDRYGNSSSQIELGCSVIYAALCSDEMKDIQQTRDREGIAGTTQKEDFVYSANEIIQSILDKLPKTESNKETINTIKNLPTDYTDCLKAIGINEEGEVLRDTLRKVSYTKSKSYKGGSTREIQDIYCNARTIMSNMLAMTGLMANKKAGNFRKGVIDYQSGRIVDTDFINEYGNYYNGIAVPLAYVDRNVSLQGTVLIDAKQYNAHSKDCTINAVIKKLCDLMFKYRSEEDSAAAVKEYNQFLNENYKQFSTYFEAERDPQTGNIVYDEETGAMKGHWLNSWFENIDVNSVDQFDGIAEIYKCRKKFSNAPVLVSSDKQPYENWSRADHTKVMWTEFWHGQSDDRDDNYAHYPYFTLADLFTERYICNKSYNYSISDFDDSNDGDVDNAIINKTCNIVIRELVRIDDVIKHREADPTHKNDIQGYDKNGDKFCSIPELNEYLTPLYNIYHNHGSSGVIAFLMEKNILSNIYKQRTEKAYDEMVQNGFLGFNEGGEPIYCNEVSDITRPSDDDERMGRMDQNIKDLNELVSKLQGNATGVQKYALNKLQQIYDDIKNNNPQSRKLYSCSEIRELLKQAEGNISKEDLNNKNIDEDNFFYDFYNVEYSISLSKFVANEDFARCEMAQMFGVDPAIFGNAGEWFKRIKGTESPFSILDTQAVYVSPVTGETEHVGRDYQNVIVAKDISFQSSLVTSGVLQRIFGKEFEERRLFLKKELENHLITDDFYKECLVLIDREAQSIINPYKKMKTTDAMALRTFDSYRRIMIMAGGNNWTKDMEVAYHHIKEGKYTIKDFEVFMRQWIPFSFGYTTVKRENGTLVKNAFLIKDSEAIMVAIYNEIGAKYDKRLKYLNKYMLDNDIDCLVFDSVTKVGPVQTLNEDDFEAKDYDTFKANMDAKFYEKDGSENSIGEFNRNIVYKVDLNYLGDHMPTMDCLTDGYVSFGTQSKKIAFSDIPDSNNIVFKVSGKNGVDFFNKKEILSKYSELLTAKMLKQCRKTMSIITDVDKLSIWLKRKVANDVSWNLQMLDALNVVTNTNGVKTLKLSLLNPIIAGRVFSMVSSLIRSNSDIKTKGGIVLNECGIFLNEKDKPRVITKKIKVKDECGNIVEREAVEAIECWFPAYMKDIAKNFGVKDENGNVTIKMDDGNFPEELREMVGYRIPTEDKYSMLPLRIKGFLSGAEGGSIILPDEITTIMGLDFDGDKFFLSIPAFEFIKDDNGHTVYKKIQFDYDKPAMEQSDLAIDNAIIDLIKSVLTHESTAPKMLNPQGFDELKRVAKTTTVLQHMPEILDNSESYKQKYPQISAAFDGIKAGHFLSVIHKVDYDILKGIADSFTSGFDITNVMSQVEYSYQNVFVKQVISVFALANSLHCVLENTKFRLSGDGEFTLCEHKCSSMYKVRAFDGSYISKTLASFFAASADTAKDPCLTELNANLVTGTAFAMMIQLGLSTEEISLFMKQPILRLIIDEALKSLYPNISDITKKAMMKYLKMAGEKNVTPLSVNEFKYKDGNVTIDNDIVRISLMKFSKKDLVKWITTSDSKKDKNFFMNQIAVASLFGHIMNTANVYKQIMLCLRFDSKKGSAGSTIGNCMKKKEDSILLSEKVDNECFPFDRNELKLLLMRYTLYFDQYDKKYDAVETERKIAKMGYDANTWLNVARTVGFDSVNYFNDFGKILNSANFIEDVITNIKKASFIASFSDKFYNLVYKDFITYLMSDSALFKDKNNQSLFKTMVFDFPSQFNDFTHRFSVLIDGSPFLKRLEYIKESLNVPFDCISFKSLGSIMTDDLKIQLQNDFDDLYFGRIDGYNETEITEIKGIMMNLVRYSYFRNQLGQTLYSYADIIPLDVYLNTKVLNEPLEHLDDVLSDHGKLEFFARLFVRNHIKDDRSIFATKVSGMVADMFVQPYKEILREKGKDSIKVMTPKMDVVIKYSSCTFEDLNRSLLLEIKTQYDEAKKPYQINVWRPYITITKYAHKYFYENYNDSQTESTVCYKYIESLGCQFGFKEYDINKIYTGPEQIIESEIPENKLQIAQVAADMMVKKFLKKRRW